MKSKFYIFVILLSFLSTVVQAQTNFTITGSLNTARESYTATLLPNGLVLVTGGDGGASLATCELYNPATGTWTIHRQPQHRARLSHGHAAAQRPGARHGGIGNSGHLASCELYYFGIEEFGSSPTMPTLAVGSTVTARTVNGLVTLNFTNVIGMPFCVLTTTNVALPVASWSALGVPTELSPGQFQFTDSQLPTAPARFYRISSPYGN